MTRDADFKALIRARMEKTGESYAAAREQLLADSPQFDNRPTGSAGSRTFTLGTPEARQEAAARVAAITNGLIGNAGATLDDMVMHVWYGDPKVFEARIPRDAIQSAWRVADGSTGLTLGVHGGRGKWLVNEASTGLVRIAIEPPVRASLRVSLGIPDEARVPLFLKPLVRDRRPRVKQLTISVDDPDALIAAINKP